MIDTNYPWRRHLSDKDFFDCVFVLGATIQNEIDRSTAVLFDRAGRPIIAQNFFLFSYAGNTDCWAIDRMDENHPCIYDQTSLQVDAKCDPPIRLKTLTKAQTSELQEETANLLRQIRRELVHQIKRPTGGARERLLIRELRSYRTTQFVDFFTALESARRCYATLLINDKTARKDYLESPVNGLEDSVLIGESLFLNCEILSRNRHIKEMGRYCQTPVHDKLS